MTAARNNSTLDRSPGSEASGAAESPRSSDTPFLRTSLASASQKTIRVLLIAPSPTIVGGQSVQATQLLKVLGEVPELKMRFFPLDQKLPQPLRWISRVRYLRTIVSSLSYNAKLFRVARNCDILHIFSAGLSSYSLWTIPALFIGKLFGKKTIVHYHDGQAEQHLKGWRTAKPTLTLADCIVTPSRFLVDVFKKYGIRARTIFNIIDVNWFQYRQRSHVRPIFLSNRGLEPLYNVECTLRAFALIQEQYPEASLTIAHDGFHRPALEQLASDLKLRNTHFIGRVAHENIPALYDTVDVYLTSPNIDNMPVSLLECLASGVPIVATRAGGIPYIVRDNETALLVDINDHEALASRAMDLLADEELVVRLTTQGLQEVKRYHWAPVREQWIALYRELVTPER